MVMTDYASILDRLTEGRALPDGCDRWGLKATDFAGRTRHGFQWPAEGWVKAPGPIAEDNHRLIPRAKGDGINVAHTYIGLASGGHRALALLLVAYAERDRLSAPIPDEHAVRLRRAYVVERLDGEDVIRRYGAGADLTAANLMGADLDSVNLSGACLAGASLLGANLFSADLQGADLRRADLSGAELVDADLRSALLDRTKLRGADLAGANLHGVDLRLADLGRARLTGAIL